MEIKRRVARTISIGGVKIGGNEPVRVQSMTNTDTKDVEATLKQIKDLELAGCEMVRVAVKDMESVSPFREIVKRSTIPVVADVHFNYRIAVEAVKAGAKGLRINPGNIGGERKVAEIVKCAADYQIPIRVGVNAGSLDKNLEKKHGGPTSKALVESALKYVSIIEKYGYDQIKISLKSSDVITVIEAYTLLSEMVDYPLHIGLTESGSLLTGAVKSAVAASILLSRGIGDTIRVSLTGPPVEEVRIAYLILSSLGLRQAANIDIISCPTCGRCEWDLEAKVQEIESKIRDIRAPIKVAVMGCAVNGPGEAKHADIGVAGGRNGCLLFRKGQIVGKFSEDQIVGVLLEEIGRIIGHSKGE